MTSVVSPQFDVFLSQQGRDQEHVQRITRFLQGRGLKVFAERWYAELILPWPQALEQNLGWCGAVLVCVGPGELSSWQHREVGRALELKAQRPGFSVIPVLLPGADPTSALLSSDSWVDLRLGADEPAELVRLENLLRRAGPGRAEVAVDSRPREEICPYRGLVPFREQDSALFYGRDAAVKDLEALLQRHTMVGVVGLGGAGKSSLVRAGLLPRLRRDHKVGWEVATLVPGEQPMHALAAALVPLLETRKTFTEAERLAQVQRLGAQFIEGSVSLSDVVVRILGQQAGSERLLLVADQWEELYTVCRNPLAWRAFIGALLDATAHAPLRVVLTMRLDFVAEALRFRPLEERLRGVLLQLVPMARDDLRQIIAQPAQKVGLSCEPALVEQLLDAMGDSDENLPLLQFTLRRLWEKRREKTLWLQDYTEMGGVQGAMSNAAERIRESMSPGEQTCLRNLLLDIVQPNPSRTVGRRRYRLSDLSEAAGQMATRLGAERLLVVSKSEEKAESTVEVAHEALIRNWATLQTWLAQDMDFLLWREKLRTLVADWEQKRRPAGLLLRGEALAQAETWAQQGWDRLAQAERDFINASNQAEQDRQRQGETQGRPMLLAADPANAEQRPRTVEDTQKVEAPKPDDRRADEPVVEVQPRPEPVKKTVVIAPRKGQWLKLAPVLVGVAAVIAVGVGWRLREAWQTTTAHQIAAVARALAREHLDTALLLAVQAFQQHPDWDTRGALLTVAASPPCDLQYLWGPKTAVLTVAASPDGQRLATGAKDGSIQLWTVAEGAALGPAWTAHAGEVNGIAFSPDSRMLASASSDRTVMLWDVSERKPVGPALMGHAGPVLGVAFSPDGRRLATCGGGGVVLLWEVAQRTLAGSPLVGHTGEVWKVAFSPDGRVLATAGADGTIRLWNVETGAAVGRLATGSAVPVLSLAFSPDAQTLGAGYGDHLIRLWSLAKQSVVDPPLAAHLGAVWSLSFAPDGKTLASAGMDHTVRLWDVARHATLGPPLIGHTGAVWGVTYIAGGRKLASAGEDAALVVWNPATRTPLGLRLPGTQAALRALACSRDGALIAAAGDDRQIHLWETARPETALAPLSGHTDAVQCLALDPGSRLLASGGKEGAIRLWDLSTRTELAPPLQGHTGCVWSVAFSSDGKLLASGGSDRSLMLWDVSRRTPLGPPLLGHNDFVGAVAFHPGDHTLVSASWDKSVILWDADTRTPLAAPFLRSTSVPACVAFSPDGRWLALGSLDNTVALWSVAERKQIGSTLAGHKAPVVSLAFSSDGQTLASGGMDNTIILWDLHHFAAWATLPNVHHNDVRGLAFGPQGQPLISAGEDGAVVMLSLDPRVWAQTALRAAHREFSPTERKLYLGF